MEFSSKADTLLNLRGKLKTGTVLPILLLSADYNHKQIDVLLDQGPLWLKKEAVIVRSSACSEDQAHSSMAGHFVSVADVQGKNSIKKPLHSKIYEIPRSLISKSIRCRLG